MTEENKLLNSAVLWPNGLHEKLFTGFSDEELELICYSGLYGYDRKLPYKAAKWIHWSAEIYSLGRCYREWLGIPSWIPLPLYGDHGINLSGQFSPHEVNSKPKFFLTWFKERAESLARFGSKIIIRIPHPWISFRRKYNIKKSPSARGTLVFYSHSNTGIEIVNYNWEEYFSEIKALKEEYHPLVICMSAHDIRSGIHKRIRDYSLPVVSVGDISSPYFSERFYNIVSNFRYATSNSGGSELFYCEELGVKYFILGKPPVYYNFSHDQNPYGFLKYVDLCQENSDLKKIELFSELPPLESIAKANFVSKVLGLDVDANSAKKMIMPLLIKEYFRDFPNIIVKMISSILMMYIPYNLFIFLRKVRNYFKRFKL